MWPSRWATVGPFATWRTVQEAAHAIASVYAPPSVATSSSPGVTPAAVRVSALMRRIASSPGCGLPGVARSEPCRRESRALDADVAAVRQARVGDELTAPVGCDCVDSSAVLVRGDQV